MPHNALSVRDVERVGFIMATVSPSAKKMLDGETWRNFVSSDEGDANHILPLLFQCLTTDMETIGITCDVDYDTLSIDPQQLFSFLNLCRLIFPNTLYPLAMDMPDIRDALRTISDGSYSTGQSAITTWLDLLGGHDGIPGLIDGFGPIVEQIRQSLTSDSRFIDYLLTFETNLELSRMTHRIDPKETERYIEVIKTALWRQVEILGRIGGIVPDDQQNALNRAVKRFSRDVVTPDDIVANQYLFLNTPATLPTDLVFSYRERWNNFKVSHPLFWEYYDARQLPLGNLEYALCIMGLAIVSKTEEEYLEALRDLLVRYPDISVELGDIDIRGGVYE